MDIVSYLVKNSADILKANYNGGMCLINSVQSVELCTFLLKHGADVNATDIQNKSALQYAIQEHRLQITKLLSDHNTDSHLRIMMPSRLPCLKGAIQIFNYLVEDISYSAVRLADANELMDLHFSMITTTRPWRCNIGGRR